MSSQSLNEFELNCELLGHSMDVRSVCNIRDSNTIISGSRDKTVKLWQKNELDEFKELVTLKHHKNFVSCVYYLESENWICTGSNDSTICIYRNGVTEPFVTLRGHQDTVCCLYKGLNAKQIISGSWDKSAKIWSIDESGMSTFIDLKGHEGTVWAVTCNSNNGKYITGSADKNIFYWNCNGEKVKVLKGHTDCIRGLISLEDGSLISCGNDAVIKYWSNEGDCIREFSGHTNFIYSIARNIALGSDVFVSCSEDSTIRLWSIVHGSLGDELTLPAQSVWSVACLNNGDIVTGSSDGVVRVFTKDREKVADSEKLGVYKLAVETRKAEINETLGGFSKNNLPGPEILNQPGTKEGQTKMIRESNGKVFCYMWEKNKWNLLGDVVGASGATQATSGKTLYEGKEYDYVFNVDISDTEPPKKLPYNNSEDPWHAAQSFIHKNNLPQVYLDQVANFIIKNANSRVSERTTVAEFQDPFTGSSRYVPGSNNHIATTTAGVDPFTGNSSYTTAKNKNLNPNLLNKKNNHFPIINLVTFDSYDAGKILSKLKDFNLKAGDNNMSVNEKTLLCIVKLADQEVNAAAAEGLLNLLFWPKDILFPVLDIARLAVRDEQIYLLLKPSTFIDNILSNLYTNAPNQLMTIRCLVNLMNHQSGQETIDIYLDKIIEGINMLKDGSPNLQIAIATLYLNLSITQIQSEIVAKQNKCQIITEGILEFLKWAQDLEACYRSMQTLGNLLCTSHHQVITAQIISVDYVMDKFREMANSTPKTNWEKVKECASDLISSF